MGDFIFPYDTRTGEQVKHSVPRRWIGHPVLGKHLSLTKPAPKPKPTTKPGPSGDDKSKED